MRRPPQPPVRRSAGPPAVHISPPGGSDGVRLDTPVVVQAVNATITDLVARFEAGPLAGTFSSDRRTWTSGALAGGTVYAVNDAPTVLAWTVDPSVATAVADLRGLAGDVVNDAVLDWAAARLGSAGVPVRRLFEVGAFGDVVPLGLLAALLAAPDPGSPHSQRAREATIRLEPRLGGPVGLDTVGGWGAEATSLVAGLLPDRAGGATARRMLARADALLAELHAEPLAELSPLLPAGLAARLARLAEALRAATAPLLGGAQGRELDGPLVEGSALAAVEAAWTVVGEHELAADAAVGQGWSRQVQPFAAAVRLVRWLSLPGGTGTGLADQLARHRDTGWVDAAVNDAATGAVQEELAAALGDVLAVVRARRDVHDVAFAAALAAHTRQDTAAPAETSRRVEVRHVEDLLPTVVVPLARATPVLLLVSDGTQRRRRL